MKKEIVARLFRQHYPSMYRRALTLLYDRQESADAVSDIFERLLTADTELDENTAGPYLLACVRNECLKRLQLKTARQRMANLYADALQLDDSPTRDEARLRRLMEFAHSQLTMQEQTIFRMRFLDGRSYEEIGAELGISRVAVWKHLSHLMTTIKEQFNISEP